MSTITLTDDSDSVVYTGENSSYKPKFPPDTALPFFPSIPFAYDDFDDQLSYAYVYVADGVQVISALGGDDTIDAGAQDDQVYGGSGNDTLYGGESASSRDHIRMEINFIKDGYVIEEFGYFYYESKVVLGGHDILAGGDGDDDLFGGDGDDQLTGDAGDDIIDGGQSVLQFMGADVSYGFLSSDLSSLFDQQVQNVVVAGGNDRISGGAGHDWLNGGDGDDVIYGDEGDDHIDGGSHTALEIMTYDDSRRSEGAYYDSNYTSDDYYSQIGIARLISGGADLLYGGLGNDSIDGDDGNDTVYGGDGDDYIRGGNVSTWHSVSRSSLRRISRDASGQNTNDEASTYAGSDLLLAGGDDQLYGDAGNDDIDGGDGNDYVSGGTGDDRVYGGQGVVQRLRSYAYTRNQDFTTGADHVSETNRYEDVYVGGGDDQLYGDDGADELNGQDGHDVIYGGTGDDVLYGGESREYTLFTGNLNGSDEDVLTETSILVSGGDDQLYGDAGKDSLYGGDGNDELYGGTDNDTIDGGTGNDILQGGEGDDLYMVDSAGDVLTETLNQGGDTVQSSISWVLGENFEHLTLLESEALNGTGNLLNNIINGNAANNTLCGEGGEDQLHGGDGNDELYGGTDNDTIDGGTGNDILQGGEGDDLYMVDSAGDVLTETLNQGGDTVQSSVSWVLGENFEHLMLLESEALNGTGNLLNNIINGNTSDNTLRGEAGDDQLYGGAGNDRLLGGDGLDTIYGGIGVDTLSGSKGSDLLSSGSGDDYVLGGSGHDEIYGGSGNDELHGSSGVDKLYGGTGNDLLYGEVGTDYIEGGTGHDQLDGGSGFDTLVGGAGDDIYMMGRGYRTDIIIENDTTSQNSDILRFGSNVDADQLWFSQQGEDLLVSIIGTKDDKVVIKDWYKGAAQRIERFEAGDGLVLIESQVNQLVTAMAGVTPPALGQFGLNAAQHRQLDMVIAATWV